MREIKFRAWFDGEMLYGLEDITQGCLSDWGDALEQFTGLKDKNGKEIYEGDVLRGNQPYVDSGEFPTAIVIIEDAGLGVIIKDTRGGDYYVPLAWAKDYEVIGNIHENPDLVPA